MCEEEDLRMTPWIFGFSDWKGVVSIFRDGLQETQAEANGAE